MQTEQVRQRLLIDRVVRFGNGLKDEFATCDRIFVAPGLALRLRIDATRAAGVGFLLFSHWLAILLFVSSKVLARVIN